MRVPLPMIEYDLARLEETIAESAALVAELGGRIYHEGHEEHEGEEEGKK